MGNKADYCGLVIAIPTRNRAALAMNAVRSALGQCGPDVRILVSDNSTEPGESGGPPTWWCRKK